MAAAGNKLPPTYDKDFILVRKSLAPFYFGFLFCCIPWAMLGSVFFEKDRSHISIPGATMLVSMGIALPIIRGIHLLLVPKTPSSHQLFDLTGFYPMTLSKYVGHFKPFPKTS